MSDELPAVIRTYLAAHASGDTEAAVATFAPEATVFDEGRTHRGRAEIRAWRANASTEWTYTTEVTGSRPVGEGQWVVAIHLEGDFPGGTADLEQLFTVRTERITDLTIK